MKILFLADLHSINIEELKNFLITSRNKFDTILLLGDIEKMFIQRFKIEFPDKYIAGVLGNHDKITYLCDVGVDNLHGRKINIGELTIYGIGGCVNYKDDFSSPLYWQEEIEDLCEEADKVDIIISHNSPYGIHDDVTDDAHVGYIGLRNYIEKHSPKYCIHGHQHKNIVTVIGETAVIGVYGGVVLDTETGKIERVLGM